MCICIYLVYAFQSGAQCMLPREHSLPDGILGGAESCVTGGSSCPDDTSVCVRACAKRGRKLFSKKLIRERDSDSERTRVCVMLPI